MHILRDENGNLIEHGAGHEHEHHHDCAEEGHCHHHHEEGHCHHHGEDGHCHAGDAKDQNAALLKYMLDHNTHHAAELDQMAQKLADDGRADVAEQIRKAVDEFQKGNLYLGLALSMVK